MIFDAAAPTRIDLAGGTLDIFPLYLLEGGALTINVAITIHTRVRLEPYSGGVAVYSDDLGFGVEAPSAAALPIGGPLDLILRAIRYCGLPARTRVVTASEAPRSSGLGASSSLLVALLATCDRRSGRRTRPDLIDLAAKLEAQSIRAPTGKQDYYAALHGGLNAIWFGVERETVEPLLSPRRLAGLERHLVLAFTEEPHASGLTNWGVIRAYLDGNPGTVRGLQAIRRISQEMREALRREDLRACARLLREEWAQRRGLAAGVSTPQIERALATARRAGALAGKACGAGGGGCVVSLSPAERKSAVEQALAAEGFRVLPFRIARRGLTVVARPGRSARRVGRDSAATRPRSPKDR
jgi:D-glycero-alpha-D-manno-heptose-7-phosphate kinase